MTITRNNVPRTAAIMAMEIEGYSVNTWHPLPDGKGKPEQVHFILDLGDTMPQLVLRLKSKLAAQTLVDALLEHMAYCWPDSETGNGK